MYFDHRKTMVIVDFDLDIYYYWLDLVQDHCYMNSLIGDFR